MHYAIEAQMALKIDSTLQAVLLEEIDGLMATLHEPESRLRYLTLREAVATEQVEGRVLPTLEKFLDLLLHSGRVRHIHGPQAEQSINRLFNQTTRGAGIQKTTSHVNTALALLEGHTIESLKFSPKSPGVIRLTLDTDQCELTLEINSEGVWLENVAVGI